ncbi:hypothetical protein C8Q75DRAFT_731798 [Abortiporus biennis]|nr:hypothetical protein C8Q75DRAFT_731798 [Abortiporus biennis]
MADHANTASPHLEIPNREPDANSEPDDLLNPVYTQPAFPGTPHLIPLPPYRLANMARAMLVVAKLTANPDPFVDIPGVPTQAPKQIVPPTSITITFHPRVGYRGREINMNVWLPVPPMHILHICQHEEGGVKRFLKPVKGCGRTVRVCLKEDWVLVAGGKVALSWMPEDKLKAKSILSEL